MRKKNRKGPQDNGFEKKVMETMQTMLKMAELSEIIEAYLNSDNKEEYMLKILEKTKTFENIDKIIMNLILNIPDKTKSIQILHRYAKSFRSTNFTRHVKFI